MVSLLVGLGLSACTEPTSISGTLTDAMTGRPIVGEVVRAEADAVEFARISSATDSRGNFSIENLAAEKQYSLVPQNAEWVLPEPVPAHSRVEVAAWRLPPSDGVYRASSELTQLVTNSTIGQLYLDNGDEIAHPLAIPGAVPTIASTDTLLFVGEVTDGWDLTRLFPAPEAPIRVARKPLALAGWWLAGAQLRVDAKGGATVERSVLQLSFTTTKLGSRTLRYLSGSATAAGRYMIHHTDVSRAILVDFGDVTGVEALITPADATLSP